MPNIHSILRERLLAAAGLIDRPLVPMSKSQYLTLSSSQWDVGFETLMRNRLSMGLLRYGRLGAKNKPQYDMVPSIIRRAQLYLVDGNDEHLVDIANLALVEYVEGKHPNKHFTAQDSGEHCTSRS